MPQVFDANRFEEVGLDADRFEPLEADRFEEVQAHASQWVPELIDAGIGGYFQAKAIQEQERQQKIRDAEIDEYLDQKEKGYSPQTAPHPQDRPIGGENPFDTPKQQPERFSEDEIDRRRFLRLPYIGGTEQEQPEGDVLERLQGFADAIVSQSPTKSEGLSGGVYRLQDQIDKISPKHRGAFLRMVYETSKEMGTRKEGGLIKKVGRESARALSDIPHSMARTIEAVGEATGALEPLRDDKIANSFSQAVRSAAEAGDDPTEGEPWYVKWPIQVAPSVTQMTAAAAAAALTGGLSAPAAVADKVLLIASQGTFWASQIAPDSIRAIEATGKVDRSTAVKVGLASGIAQAAVELIEINPFKGAAGKRGLLNKLIEYGKTYGKEIGVEEFLQGGIESIGRGFAEDGNPDLAKAFIDAAKAVKDAAGPGLFLVGAGAPIQLSAEAIRSGQAKGLDIFKWIDLHKFSQSEKDELRKPWSRRLVEKLADKFGAVKASDYSRYADRNKAAEAVDAALTENESATVAPQEVSAPTNIAPQSAQPQTQPEAAQAEAQQPATEDGQPVLNADTMAEQDANRVAEEQGVEVGSEDYVGIKNALTAQYREQFGATPMGDPRRRTWAQATEDARAEGLDGSPEGVAKAVELATGAIYDSVLDPNGVMWTDTQAAGVGMAMSSVVNEINRLAAKMETVSDVAEMVELERQAQESLQHLNQLTAGSKIAGNPIARALAARKILYKSDLSIDSVLRRATVKKGDALTVDEANGLREQVKQLESEIESLKKQQKRSDKKQANRALRETKRARKKMSEANREKSLEQMYAEMNDMMKAGC